MKQRCSPTPVHASSLTPCMLTNACQCLHGIICRTLYIVAPFEMKVHYLSCSTAASCVRHAVDLDLQSQCVRLACAQGSALQLGKRTLSNLSVCCLSLVTKHCYSVWVPLDTTCWFWPCGSPQWGLTPIPVDAAGIITMWAALGWMCMSRRALQMGCTSAVWAVPQTCGALSWTPAPASAASCTVLFLMPSCPRSGSWRSGI